MVSVPALLIFLFPLACSPGPGNLFFAANGARFGFRSTLGANAGYHLATLVVSVGLGLGLGAGIDRYPSALAAVKIAGGIYVLRLAWGLLRSTSPERSEAAQPADARDGALLLLLNPKAYVIIALMYSQFLGADGARSRPIDVAVIALVFTLNNLVAFCVWTAVGDSLLRRFRSPSSARRLNGALAFVLAAVACWMLMG